MTPTGYTEDALVEQAAIALLACNWGHLLKDPPQTVLTNEPLAKVLDVVRQAHHKREKVNNLNPASVHPELVEG